LQVRTRRLSPPTRGCCVPGSDAAASLSHGLDRATADDCSGGGTRCSAPRTTHASPTHPTRRGGAHAHVDYLKCMCACAVENLSQAEGYALCWLQRLSACVLGVDMTCNAPIHTYMSLRSLLREEQTHLSCHRASASAHVAPSHPQSRATSDTTRHHNGALSLQRSDTAPPIPRTGGDGSMIAPLRHPCVTCARRLLAARRPSKMPARPRERLLRESARPSNTTYSTPHTCSLDHDQKPPDAAIMVKEPEVRRAPPKVPPNWSCRRELSLTPAFSYVV
jgi:hypothetical protein